MTTALSSQWIKEKDLSFKDHRNHSVNPRPLLQELYARQTSYQQSYPDYETIVRRTGDNGNDHYAIRADQRHQLENIINFVHSTNTRALSTHGIHANPHALARHCEQLHHMLFSEILQHGKTALQAQLQADSLLCKIQLPRDNELWIMNPQFLPALHQHIQDNENFLTPSQIGKMDGHPYGTKLETIEKKLAYLFCQSVERDGLEQSLKYFRYSQGSHGGVPHWQIHEGKLELLNELNLDGRKHTTDDSTPWLHTDVMTAAQAHLKEAQEHGMIPSLLPPSSPTPRAKQLHPTAEWERIDDPRGKMVVAQLFMSENPKSPEDYQRLYSKKYQLIISKDNTGKEHSHWLVHPDTLEQFHELAARYKKIDGKHREEPFGQRTIQEYDAKFKEVKSIIAKNVPRLKAFATVPDSIHAVPTTKIRSATEILHDHMQGEEWLDVKDARGKFVVTMLHSTHDNEGKERADDVYRLKQDNEGTYYWQVHKSQADEYFSTAATYKEDGAATRADITRYQQTFLDYLERKTSTNTLNKPLQNIKENPYSDWVLVTESKAKSVIATAFFQENLSRSTGDTANHLKTIHDTMFHLTYDKDGTLCWLVPPKVAQEAAQKAANSKIDSEEQFQSYAKFLENTLELIPPSQALTHAARVQSSAATSHHVR